jgi:streptomycin 6-kinase
MADVAERFVIPDDLARALAGEGHDDWLAELPALVARIAAEWRIEVGAPFLPGGMTAWVALARDDAGRDLVLKVGWPHPEAAHEADGLRAWDGAGAIRVHRVGERAEATVLLLERCRPGTQLRASPAEEHDLVIASRTAPPTVSMITSKRSGTAVPAACTATSASPGPGVGTGAGS